MTAIIGVLALQGDFAEHVFLLKKMGVRALEVRSKKGLAQCRALIIPGGESTTMANLLESTGLGAEIKKMAKKGMPIYGTCAGAILLAKKVVGEKRFRPLGIIDIEVRRNAYGRQLDSFEAELEVLNAGKMVAVFIRAPVISRTGKGVEVLASLEKKPVLVKKGNILAGTFHPETEGNTKIHELFISLIQ
ncbi:MAG: pyridoxal 5'-phosphate synthase glutaminase subunit PdxT [archaeon]|nr:pyridoxal 5'-phosphate synthase glutaminase subunit PdxT [archaeon]